MRSVYGPPKGDRSMTSMTERAGLKVAPQLAAFIEDRALPGTGIDADAFWRGTAAIFAKFAPENAALLARRAALPARTDDWQREKDGQPFDAARQRTEAGKSV